MNNIVFIVDYYYYKNGFGKTSYNFVNYLTKSKKYNINLFYTDQYYKDVHTEIIKINPEMIIVFEMNSFQKKTKSFNFIFTLKIPIYLFMDDTYYISSKTANCKYTKLVNGFIFWYKNDMIKKSYEVKYPLKKIINFSSRYVNTNIYKDYNLEKKYDILLYGTRNYDYDYKNEELIPIQQWISNYENINNVIINDKINFYPLRSKLENILINNWHKLKNRYNFNIIILDEKSIDNSKIANENLSKLINQSYLTIACSSIADVLLHKYLEISASKSVILGNYPSDYKNLFDGNIIEVNEFMSDKEILSIIIEALQNKDKLKEIADRLYEKVINEHNLDKAVEDFDNIIPL
jgi:hypothetical protein